MTANDNKSGEPAYVYFSFKYEDQGIIKTTMNETDTRDKLNRELATLFGPEGITITEFRPATDTEVSEYETAVGDQIAPETNTIN